MAEELSNLEQYKMLREEIMQHMSEMYRTDFWGAAAIATVYSFLFSKAHSGDLMWFIPPVVLFVAGVRVCVIFRRMQLIGKYLELIEEDTFTVDSKLIGWQRYLSEEGREKPTVLIAICIWFVVLVAAFFASFYFYCHGAGSDRFIDLTHAFALQDQMQAPPALSGR
jgi:hypothetical protein